MGEISKKDELIYDYLKEGYNTQKELLTQIDARVGNYLLIIGLILGASYYFFTEIINLYATISLINFFIILTLYLIANGVVIIALWNSIKIFRMCQFFTPGVNDSALKNLLNREPEKVNKKILIADLSNNYLDAYRTNAVISKERYRASKSIKNWIHISIAFFMLISAIILVIKINNSKPYSANSQMSQKLK